MSVYDLNIEGLRKTFMKFHQTLYGRTVFMLAYFIPSILFLTALIMAILALAGSSTVLLYHGEKVLICFVVSFILANIYFYSEIRKFCEHEDKKKK